MTNDPKTGDLVKTRMVLDLYANPPVNGGPVPYKTLPAYVDVIVLGFRSGVPNPYKGASVEVLTQYGHGYVREHDRWGWVMA